jgi:hypothetical protein
MSSLQHKIVLKVPPGMDFDLVVYTDCTYIHAAESTNGGLGVAEGVIGEVRYSSAGLADALASVLDEA